MIKREVLYSCFFLAKSLQPKRVLCYAIYCLYQRYQYVLFQLFTPNDYKVLYQNENKRS